MPHIIVDTTGGDLPPAEVVAGALRAVEEIAALRITLAGEQQALEQALAGKTYDHARVALLPCTQTITNHEHPATAIRRKKDSAIVAGLQLCRNGQADGFVSCGSTGAVLAGATLLLGRLPGIARPALVPMLPTRAGTPVLLIDSGANMDCKPNHLQQFAVMGHAYMQVMQGLEKPRVGLLNIGAEAEKGNALCLETYPLLQQLPINFTGNIEARDMLSGSVDVIVADAFAGNVALKSAEGALKMMFSLLKQEIAANTRSKLGALLLKPALYRLRQSMDYTRYGGAPLLGVKGCVYKAHGTADQAIICRMLHQATEYVDKRVDQAVQQAIAACGAAWVRGEDTPAQPAAAKE